MERIITMMKRVLASSYAVYLKTQNYHWNIRSRHAFRSLHKLFEEQYEELAEAVDTIAEHIRQLGSLVPASFTDFQVLSKIKDGDECLYADQMIEDLAEDQEKLIAIINEGITLTNGTQDKATEDLLIDRLRVHKKNKWMLESSLQERVQHIDHYERGKQEDLSISTMQEN
ncbi:MAG: DNA starvation/stationary phase protection protein [Bacteroidota bacterium]